MSLSDARMHTTDLTLRTTILLLVLACGVDAIIVPSSVTVEFTCTAPDRPIWYLNEKLVLTNGTCYRSVVKRALDQTNNTVIVTINDNNDTCNRLNVSCQLLIAQQYHFVHNTTLIFQGPLLSPENIQVILSVNTSTIEWNPPYYSVNNDVIRVDPHITQYTVYIIDNCTGNITVVKNVTETRFTFDASQDFSCPMYQVSAWNAGGEGELSEPVHGCISHTPQKVAAGSVVMHTTASQVLIMHVNVTDLCKMRKPNYFIITVMNSGRTVNTTTVEYDHQSGSQLAIRIELPQNVDMCSLVVTIRAGNSAGMSLPTEIQIECPTTSKNSDSTPPASTTPQGCSHQIWCVVVAVMVAVTAVAIVLVVVVVTIHKCKKRLQVKSSEKCHDTNRPSYEEPPQSIPTVAVSLSPISENTTTS